MTIYTVFAIAFALAIDAFAVSVAAGVMLETVNFRQTFRMAWHFGFFQSLMTLLGWLAGFSVRHWIENVDHWLAFGLLLLVGGKMIRDAVNSGEKNPSFRSDPTCGGTLILLSVATSIDALAVGLSLAMMGTAILVPALVIGLVAAALTAIGMVLGRRIGVYWGKKAELLGGGVLIAIGLLILYEHMV